jgi:hypothetical protein
MNRVVDVHTHVVPQQLLAGIAAGPPGTRWRPVASLRSSAQESDRPNTGASLGANGIRAFALEHM